MSKTTHQSNASELVSLAHMSLGGMITISIAWFWTLRKSQIFDKFKLKLMMLL